MKKIYEEPSLDLTKINFGRIMDGDDDYELIALSQPGGGAGGGGAGGGD